MSPGEEGVLKGMVGQAWELRDGPYLRDACQAIVDWHQRRPLARLERRQAETASLHRLLHSLPR